MSRLNDSEPKGNLDMSSQRSTINQEGWRERVVKKEKLGLREERSQILQKNTCFIEKSEDLKGVKISRREDRFV